MHVVRDDENSPLEAGLHHCGFAAGLTASGPATTITVVDPEVGEVGEAAKVGGYTPPPTAQPLATSAPETVKDGSESSLRQPLLAPPPVAAQPEAATPAWAALPVSGKIIWLNFYLCEHLSGDPRPIECQRFLWVDLAELANYNFPPANELVIEKLTAMGNTATLSPEQQMKVARQYGVDPARNPLPMSMTNPDQFARMQHLLPSYAR